MGRMDRTDESSMRMVDAGSSVVSSVASSVQLKRIVLSSSFIPGPLNLRVEEYTFLFSKLFGLTNPPALVHHH